MIVAFTRAEVTQVVSSELFLVEKSQYKVDAFWRADLIGPYNRYKTESKFRSIVELLFRDFDEL